MRAIPERWAGVSKDEPVNLLNEQFREFPLGQFPHDYGPWGEYHYMPPEGYRGAWYEPTCLYSWTTGRWQVAEEDGLAWMEQCAVFDRGIPMLVAGDPVWDDYTLSADLRPLSTGAAIGLMGRYQDSRNHYLFRLAAGERAELVCCSHEGERLLAEAPFAVDVDTTYTLSLRFRGSQIVAAIDGRGIFEVRDAAFTCGRIGLYEGETVPLHVGGKVSGKSGNTNFGGLVTRTGEVEELVPGATMGAFRVRQNVLEESTVGAIATFGDPSGAEGSYMVGADATYQTSRFRVSKNFIAGAWGMVTDREGLSGDKTAFGAKLAQPEHPVVGLIGDGGAQFALSEMASAAEAGVSPIFLVWNNRGYDEIRYFFAESGVEPIGVDLHTLDFISLARSLGCSAQRAADLEELKRALRGAQREAGPTLIEVQQSDFSDGFATA